MRYPDWEDRFVKALQDKTREPFDIAGNDCVRFAADVVESYTGIDIAASLRHSYKTKKEARKLIDESAGGFYGLIDRALTPLGICEYAYTRFAKRGDLALIEMRGNQALGICNGEAYATAGKDGIVWVGKGHVTVAWEIPLK
jgi:hypothetical protein